MDTRGGRSATVLALLVVVAATTAGVGAGLSDRPAGQTTTAETLGATQVDADTVLLEADLRADGSAVWTIEYLVRLESQNDTDAFEELAADVRANRSQYTSQFADRIGRTVAGAENSTGREMTVRNVSVRTSQQDIGREYGVVTYTFRWTGFGTTNETAIAAGDALAGFYIDDGTRLTMTWPDGYRVTTLTPDPDEQTDRSAVWAGPRDFGRDGPTVVLTEGSGPGPDARGGGTTLLAAGALVVAVLLGALVLLARRRGLLAGSDSADGEGGGANAGTDPASETTDDADDGPPEELLSNEERVLGLLEEEGGRIKQQEVAQRLDWTDAKTSQVVTSLAEDDEIEKFRIGRENVLALPEESDL